MSDATTLEKMPAEKPKPELPLWVYMGAARFASPVALCLPLPLAPLRKKL